MIKSGLFRVILKDRLILNRWLDVCQDGAGVRIIRDALLTCI